MKRLLQSVGYKLRAFMQGRYGTDELSHFLSVTGLILFLLSCLIPPLFLLYFPALALLIWSWVRSLSKNICKRQRERDKYLAIRGKIKQKFKLWKNMWSERKTHRYYKCPHCKATLRIANPGKGRTISITCPKCHGSIEKKT